MRELLSRHPDYLLVFIYGFEAHARALNGEHMDLTAEERAQSAAVVQGFFQERAIVLVDRRQIVSVQKVYSAEANTILFIDPSGAIRIKERMGDLLQMAKNYPEFR